ncbi:MAG: MTAP family purine nucleoside phosphorylase [Methanospirillum sp.]|nr:MTAP family purine nucleoside phosphorylase [Methanospirillum sp.]
MTGRLAVIGGTSLIDCNLPPLEPRAVQTPYGAATLLEGRETLLLQRHREGRPPHRINHRAHLAALALLGADRVVLIGSTGSLRREIPPGSLLVPGEYASLAPIPTVHDHAIVHASPGFSPGLSERLAAIAPGASRGGVYVQTPGPRLETRREIRALAAWGDVVGMTCASEAALANELGLEVAALCTVDNYANGIGDREVSFEAVVAAARANCERTGAIVARIMREL